VLDITTAYIALGANLSDPRRQIESALKAIAHLPKTTFVRTSSLYRSAPVGYTAQPEFVNAVCEVATGLTPQDLLRQLLEIERQHGRERSFANAPRTLDLDIVLYGSQVIEEPGLIIPHPRMLQRAFVLMPLAEIAPQVQIPNVGAVVDQLAAVAGQSIEKLLPAVRGNVEKQSGTREQSK
jgi:2-amino-4-hydroxy-6-hydroxymethyldihydropteridine diphosphokinase